MLWIIRLLREGPARRLGRRQIKQGRARFSVRLLYVSCTMRW